jgi:hypothetical protein
MDTFLSKVRLLPYAVGTVSIVIRDASAVHIYKPNAGATSTVEENATHATDGNPFQGDYATSTASHPPTTSAPLHASELQTEFSPEAWANADENQYAHLSVHDDPFGGDADDTPPPPPPVQSSDHTGAGNTTASTSQLRSLFSDEQEGQRYLHLHREAQRNGHGVKHPFLMLHKPVPVELLPFMYTDVPALPGVVQLNVHIAVTGRNDSF